MTTEHSLGSSWSGYYRGYRLQTNPDGDVWWQAYQGTDRLFLDPTPDHLVDSLLELKHLGGRVRVTEANDVLTRIEGDNGYETVWVGTLSPSGTLVPDGEPEYGIEVVPEDLSTGDLWPSVYDGAKYSFGPGAERVWWANPETHRRHPVETILPSTVITGLTRLKPRGGSFRVTPWDDVLTLVDVDKLSEGAKAAFEDLPRVVKNLIALRKDRGGVEKLPVYVGSMDRTPIEIGDPPSLTDPVSADDLGLDEWTESLGETTAIDAEDHTVEGSSEAADGQSDSESDTDRIQVPDDDPMDW
jgi:hypothetical protein